MGTCVLELVVGVIIRMLTISYLSNIFHVQKSVADALEPVITIIRGPAMMAKIMALVSQPVR